MENTKKPVAIASRISIMFVLGLLLLMYGPNFAAAAATGGRMGGTSFSSRKSSASRSYSSFRRRSYVYPSNSCYSDRRNYVSPSDSYYSGRRNYVSPVEAEICNSTSDGTGNNFECNPAVVLGFVIVLFGIIWVRGIYADLTTVLKLQVGLTAPERSLQKYLNQIAETADTSTPEGLHYVLTETALALLRYHDYCISARLSIDVTKNMEEGEKRLNQLSIEERGKFDEETLVNFNNMKKQSSTIRRPIDFRNEHIVVTILLAAEEKLKLPCINNSKDLKEALQKLASIPSTTTKAVEVLWTPQDEYDTLSEEEMLRDYPLLRTF
ncbi:hypothetical protein ABFS82_14G182700 [Erythranthe guttata]|uniref:Uncharacterized protein n=2 Tax=Erythranthe guttata TaxID=4155 RepID=A0A022RBG6_ERYGU|nr:PREDICTED: uncharacterized protein LOC105958465 [Erythranthe guttata]EYU37053.1 hypothetical protein MIMGU_mgv1a010075mg [Erythranthe guttata]|eukprot:XP_012837920.1 PREDICTED: uncharacterized protein LOC105958465 [Erythranthe guttata]